MLYSHPFAVLVTRSGATQKEERQMRTILTTVGTSLSGNAQRSHGGEHLHEAQIARFIADTPPTKTSAETNSLSRLLQTGDTVVFLHSQTEEGTYCAEALCRYYNKLGFHASVREIQGLDYKETRFKQRGLHSLISVLIELIRQGRKEGREVLINATGGFKAETAYATVVGLLFGIPVYYIHEVFQDIVEMPRTPVGWDYTLVLEYEDLLQWLSVELRTTAEVEERTRSLPHDFQLLLTKEEGYTFLSPAGEVLYEAFIERVQSAPRVPVLLSRPALEFYLAAEDSVRQLFDHIFVRLRLSDLRRSTSHQVRNCDVFVFPSGHHPGRLFYSEEADGSLRVYEMTLHDDRYQKLIARGVRRKNYRDFAPLPACI
jgi:putative CRISPR-associated protein (TIGR02619 family)